MQDACVTSDNLSRVVNDAVAFDTQTASATKMIQATSTIIDGIGNFPPCAFKEGVSTTSNIEWSWKEDFVEFILREGADVTDLERELKDILTLFDTTELAND